jgi:hypothetical protein
VVDTIVERLHREFQALATLLEREAEPSLRITADDTFRKVLLLSAASYFEYLVTEAVVAFVSSASAGNARLVEFVRRKGLSRQYHTLFNWEGNNANSFFGLFGDSYRAEMEAFVKNDAALAESIRAFLEMGRERNRLIHQDLGSFSLEKTATEIFDLYRRAARFVTELPALLARETPSGTA